LAFRDYLRVLSRRWPVIVLVTVLGTGTGIVDSVVATPEYRATATLFVSLPGGDDAFELSQGNAFAQDRVRSYIAVATGPAVTGAVVDSLRLHTTPAQLAARITAVAPVGTVLLRLTVADSSAARAALIGNAVADRLARVIARMERTGDRNSSPVRLAVVERASAPSAPVFPDIPAGTALALAVSLLVAMGVAVALETLETSVRDTAALAECLAQAGGPAVLAGIVREPWAARRPVSPCADPTGPRVEGFRRLRVNLRFAEVGRRPKVIAVTSPLPRDGKSSVSLDLAAALAGQGAKVCLVDCDLRRPAVARALGLAGDAGLTTALVGGTELRPLLQSAGSFTVLTSGLTPPDPARLLGGARFRSVLRALAEEFDHVVVDTAAVLPFADTAAMAPAVDGFLLVARAGRTGRSQIVEALSTLRRTDVPVLGAVLNAVPARAASDGCRRGHGHGAGRTGQSGIAARLTALVPSRRAAAVPGRRRAAESDGTLVAARPRR
jgi:capsular exopolysaccharide synthesis family protein